MGHELRRPLREAIPPGLLTKSERYVLLEIADLANDKTRVARFGPEKVAKLVGMTPAAVRKHVQRMSYKGIELRIPISTGSDGRPVYAHDGHQTNYCIPADLVARLKEQSGQSVHPLKPEGGQTVQAPASEGGQNGLRGWTEQRERVDKPSTPSPQSSSENQPSTTSSSSGPVVMIRAACDASEEEAEEIVSLIRSDMASRGKRVESWSGFVAKITANGDLAARLADLRARNTGASSDRGEEARRQHAVHCRTLPPCEHNIPGGHEVHPATGWMPCVTQRKRHEHATRAATRPRDRFFNGTPRDNPSRNTHRPFLNDQIPDEAYDKEFHS